MIDINLEIRNLVDYAVDKKLISERDKIYCINKLLEALNLDCYYEPRNYIYKKESVEDILDRINKWARENKLIENDNIYTSDFFDTYVISQLIQMPSVIEDKFYQQYNKSPEDATKYYYEFAKNSNYIREKRITKDIKWKHSTEYGVLDITINLSKPEKDPKMITKTKDMQLSKYPKCFLCKENEGHCGRVKNLSRSNHRVIGVELDEEKWYMHYSPYAYYNEHCILVKAERAYANY